MPDAAGRPIDCSRESDKSDNRRGVSPARTAAIATADNPRRVPFVAEMWRAYSYPFADKQLTSRGTLDRDKLLIRIALA